MANYPEEDIYTEQDVSVSDDIGGTFLGKLAAQKGFKI
jgi:hypothetical protein